MIISHELSQKIASENLTQNIRYSAEGIENKLKDMIGDRGDMISGVHIDSATGEYKIIGRKLKGNELDVTDFTSLGINVRSPKSLGRSGSSPSRQEFSISIAELDEILFGKEKSDQGPDSIYPKRGGRGG